MKQLKKKNIQIYQAHSSQDISATRELFLEYAQSLGFSLCFQNFDKELKELPGCYAPPDGCIFVAMVDNKYAGCVAIRKFNHDTCEMKRLYIKPEFRKLGIGRQISLTIIDKAKELGYKRMILDTIATMESAVKLYSSLGFKSVDPYYDNPLENVCYFSRELC
jgi:ribosomal protein S18 acetylase RimI-like enzyme